MFTRRLTIILSAVIIFALCVAFIVSAGQVSVRGGILNVSDTINAGILYVDVLSGKIGIGTNSPSYALSVNGSLQVLNSSGSSILFINSSDGVVTISGDFVSGCPSDMVSVGSFCIDRYEASVWTGRGGTGTQAGNGSDTYDSLCGGGDNATTFNCYAASVYNVTPSTYITWFQAMMACENSGKRLCTNYEWQRAAMSTPDNYSCNIYFANNDVADDLPAGAVDGECYDYGDNDQSCSKTGTAAGCKTSAGVYDMVGNVWEWTSDWTQGAAEDNITASLDENAGTGYGDDYQYAVRDANQQGNGANFPAVQTRSGAWNNMAYAGVFASTLSTSPSNSSYSVGIRCCK